MDRRLALGLMALSLIFAALSPLVLFTHTEPNIYCDTDEDCVVFGQDGDCNCGCFNKDYNWQPGGDCFCAAPDECSCIENKCVSVFQS